MVKIVRCYTPLDNDGAYKRSPLPISFFAWALRNAPKTHNSAHFLSVRCRAMVFGSAVTSRRFKPSSRFLSVGEQSNAYRILLRYTRQSQHRRIKGNAAMNAWLPQASYPYGNFYGASSLNYRGTEGLIGHTFMVCIHTANQNQEDFYPSVSLGDFCSP